MSFKLLSLLLLSHCCLLLDLAIPLPVKTLDLIWLEKIENDVSESPITTLNITFTPTPVVEKTPDPIRRPTMTLSGQEHNIKGNMTCYQPSSLGFPSTFVWYKGLYNLCHLRAPSPISLNFSQVP